IHIVQRGIADGDATDKYRYQSCHRRNGAGAANLELHITYGGSRLFRREFVGHGPARSARIKTQLFLPAQVVDLDYGAVDFVVQRVAFGQQTVGVVQTGLPALYDFALRVQRQAQFAKFVEHGAVQTLARLIKKYTLRPYYGSIGEEPQGT